MTVAVCFKCGAMKLGAFGECEKCLTKPETDDELATSFIFTDHFLEDELLEKISESIANGTPVEITPELKSEVMEAFSRTENAEFLAVEEDEQCPF